ncbi:MAG TPA: AMP-binding protein, partial [Chloroflexota bacterium]|nr:AMP-binding protein [Chloroflexota bacterium]
GELGTPTLPLEQLHARRDERLRALLRVAKERSPWHAERLRHVDPAAMAGDDLTMLPAMTKADLMANWDAIVTDRRLTLDLANAHVSRVRDEGPAYLLDEYIVLASGGSSGRHGVFVWDFDGWLAWPLTVAPLAAWVERHTPWSAGDREATVLAAHATHASAATEATFAVPGATRAAFPLTLPLDEIVAGLNAFQPTQLTTYPSLLHRLAREVRAGRLHISPTRLASGAEPLLPEARRAIEAAFGVPVFNAYGASETGYMAVSFPGSPGLHLIEDSNVYEPVDEQNLPVPPGRRAAKLLITNVVNQVLPLIRYELTDEVTFLAEPNPDPWTGRRTAEPQGRLDDIFWYDGQRAVHPYIFWTALGTVGEILEYQVRQTPRGADIAVLAAGDLDQAAITRQLVAAYDMLELPNAEIVLRRVSALERLTGSGKLKRFFPLPH